MKKIFFTLLMVFSAIVGMSQTIGETFYVYRNDGMINTFFRSEIDSIAYSYYDADSLIYDEIVSQVVYTQDSIYQIPLAVIDSVGFVTPETKYQADVIKLEGEIRDYIIGSDSLTVYFRSDTPNDILPKVGDKLVTIEMSDVFEGGFLGQVETIEQKSDTIVIICNLIGLEEAFDCFYYSNSYQQQAKSTNQTRTLAINGSFSPDPFEFSLNNYLKAWLKPVDCPWKVTPKYDVTIAPSFIGKGSIIVHPIKGVVVSLDIKHQTAITQDIAMTGSVGASHDFTPGAFPITAIVPFVWVYGEFGVFLKTNVKVSMEEHWTQSLSYNIHYETAYQPALAMTTSIPKLSINGINLTSEHNGKCLVEGSVSGGIYGEIGIALLEKHVASAGFRLEGGLKLVGNTMIYDSDTQESLFTTSLYDKLESSDSHLKAFCSVGMDARLIHVGKAGIGVFSKEWELTKFKLVPDFSNTTLTRSVTNPAYLTATTTASGGAIFPCTLGFRLFEGNDDNSIKGTSNHSYWSITDKTDTFSDEFEASTLLKRYTVYPTVDMGLGFEMIANPSAEVELGATPITLDVENVSETTAKVWGRIEGHELLDETTQFGLGYEEVGGAGTVSYDASSIDANGVFSVEFMALKPNTTYKYFAYLVIDGETYYGEDKEFTTKGDGEKEAYYVKIGYSATYYYDEKCKSRGGHPISRVHNVSDIGLTSDTPLREVTFDSTFSDFHPLRFSFNYCSGIWSIENLNYLNTSYITDMSNMFAYCSILSSLDLSSFDTANVTDMGGMFQGCNSLKSLDLSSFNTANVNNMMQMFYGCTSLTDLNLNSFNTAKVTNMKRMFENCKSMTSLDLNSFNTANVTDMEDMFGCSSLQNLDFRNFNTSNLSSRDGIFGCDALVSLDISNLVLTNENGRALFDGLRKLQDLNLSNANTSNATDMSAMFRDCKSLISIDLSSFNTTNVTRMSEMFSGCSSLTNLNLNGFNTTKVKSMWYMFDGCSSLTTLDLSSFDTSNVTDIRSMFSLCSSLTALDLSSFSISNVSASGMFYGCSSLTTIYAGNWVIDKGGGMFYLCKNLVGDKGTKIGQNLYDYDKDGNPLYYYCSDDGSAAHIDGGKDNPGLFTAK